MSRAASQSARDRLLVAATRLLAERGVAGVNTNEIARAAGAGVGTFYAHFGDKQQALRAIVLRGLDALTRRVDASDPGPGAPLAERVRSTVEAAVDLARQEPALFRVAFGPDAEQAGRGPSPRALERALADLQRAGVLDPAADPAVAARAYLAAQSAVLRWWLVAPAPVSREAIVETLLRLHPAHALGHGR